MAGLDGVSKILIDNRPIRATIHSTAAKKRERVIIRVVIVNCDIPQHVFADLLRQVNINAQKVSCHLLKLNQFVRGDEAHGQLVQPLQLPKDSETIQKMGRHGRSRRRQPFEDFLRHLSVVGTRCA